MSVIEPAIPVVKGQLVCWSADGTDFLKFLIFNYLLHAITILSSPGDGILLGVVNKLIGLSMPLCGVGRAITIIYRFAHSGKTPLDTALRAGALCMVARGVSDPLNRNPHPELANGMLLDGPGNLPRSGERSFLVLCVNSSQCPGICILCERTRIVVPLPQCPNSAIRSVRLSSPSHDRHRKWWGGLYRLQSRLFTGNIRSRTNAYLTC